MNSVRGRALLDLEPDFDAPPQFREERERRMHVRARRYWEQARGSKVAPALADLAPWPTADFTENACLIQRAAETGKVRIEYVGARLREQGRLPHGELDVTELPEECLVVRLLSACPPPPSFPHPVDVEEEIDTDQGGRLLYRGVLLPLSERGKEADSVLIVVNWKEVAGDEMIGDLRRETERIAG